MDYFLWTTIGDVDDESLVFIDDPPKGMELSSYKLAMGKSAKKAMPDNPQIHIRKENMGNTLPGFIGNTNNVLILSKTGVKVLCELCDPKKMEIFPISIVKPDGQLLSRDYSIVNPLQTVACLAKKASELQISKKGDFIAVKQVVLLKEKVKDAPHLFRLKENPQNYIFSRILGRALNAAKVTNVWGQQLALLEKDRRP